MDGFAGRTVLVTGAAGGIGGAIVRRLVGAGAEVVAADRSVEALQAIARETGARPLAFDLLVEDSVRDALHGETFDGLVNCAGFGGLVAPLLDVRVADFDRVVAVNARGALLVTQHVARAMVAAGRGGAIVNVSSQASLVALAGHAAYAASKSALDSLTRVAALELGPHRIRVNSVHPTVVMTPMSASYWGRPEIGDPFLAAVPLGRWATEEDVAGPVVFLLGDGAAMVTGAALPVDGGYTCR